MEKKYYNSNLDSILSKYINEETYKGTSDLLKEIFQRRAHEYEFSNEHMEGEIKNFTNNCKRINMYDFGSALGVYRPFSKSILINVPLMMFNKMNGIDLFGTLTHEVYHAISMREDLSCGLEYFDNSGKLQSRALDEIFTEVASNRTSNEITEANNYTTLGYASITPIVNLIAKSFGVSEKDLLKAGIQNRNEFRYLI